MFGHKWTDHRLGYDDPSRRSETCGYGITKPHLRPAGCVNSCRVKTAPDCEMSSPRLKMKRVFLMIRIRVGSHLSAVVVHLGASTSCPYLQLASTAEATRPLQGALFLSRGIHPPATLARSFAFEKLWVFAGSWYGYRSCKTASTRETFISNCLCDENQALRRGLLLAATLVIKSNSR